MNINIMLSLIATISLSLNALSNDQIVEEWGPPTNNVQMAISLKAHDAVIKPNEDFKLLVRLKNLSPTNVATFLDSVPSTDLLDGLSCEIKSPSGKDISPKVIYDNVSRRGLNVRFNEVSEFEFRLSEICKFDEIGAYSIVTRKEVLVEKDKGWIVVSNPLLITVISTNGATTNLIETSGAR